MSTPLIDAMSNINLSRKRLTRAHFKNLVTLTCPSHTFPENANIEGDADLVTACLSYDAIEHFIERAGITERSLVVDIGMGRGMALFQAAATTGCAASGVEIKEDLVLESLQLRQLLSKHSAVFANATRNVHGVCGDIITLEPALLAQTLLYPQCQEAFPNGGVKYDRIVILINNVRFHENGALPEAVNRLIQHIAQQARTSDLACDKEVIIFHAATLFPGHRRIKSINPVRLSPSDRWLVEHQKRALVITMPNHKSFQGFSSNVTTFNVTYLAVPQTELSY